MASATLNKAVNKITDKVSAPGAENKASTIIKAICISTDKKSLKNSQKLVAELEDIIKNKLPLTDDKISVAKKNYSNTNENLKKIESFLGIISKIFDSGHKIEMDEQVMFDFLANMQKAKAHLSYISDYLELALQVNNEKKAAKKTYSIAELVNSIKAA
jgi:hypothetical protein